VQPSFKDIIAKAKKILSDMEEMEKDYSFDGVPISTSSVGYLNPSFTSLKRPKKYKKKKGERYLR
jgi:hypothetical protein